MSTKRKTSVKPKRQAGSMPRRVMALSCAWAYALAKQCKSAANQAERRKQWARLRGLQDLESALLRSGPLLDKLP